MSANLELWQTEWCPSSHRVRQRLTELGLSFTARQVPVEREARTELEAKTGARTIPVLVADADVVCGEPAILAYLDERFTEPVDAVSQRERAAKARREELEDDDHRRRQPRPGHGSQRGSDRGQPVTRI
jgi:glutathione S-transferase